MKRKSIIEGSFEEGRSFFGRWTLRFFVLSAAFIISLVVVPFLLTTGLLDTYFLIGLIMILASLFLVSSITGIIITTLHLAKDRSNPKREIIASIGNIYLVIILIAFIVYFH